MPNNLQLGYYKSALHSHAWPVDHVNFPFLVHKVRLHLPKDYLMVALNQSICTNRPRAIMPA